MSKQEAKNSNAAETNVLTPAQINENAYQAAMGQQVTPIDRMAAYDLLMSAPETDTVDLNGGEYLKFEDYPEGTKFVFQVTGLTSWTNKKQQVVKAVRLEDFKDGKQFVCAAAVMYSSCEKLTQLPCLIRVTYSGMKKTGNGDDMYDLKIEAFKSVPASAPANGAAESGKDLPF